MRRAVLGVVIAVELGAVGLGAVGLGAVGLVPTAHADPCCGPIAPNGHRLQRFLDGSGVDHLWLPGYRVAWESGALLSGNAPKNTHCSAYVAAVSVRLGLAMLRPPEHSTTLLANAQVEWLRGGGAGSGWRSLPDAMAAQAAANRGELVVEAFANPDPTRSGHIAIVRPSEQSRAMLERDGPRETQAGATNALDMSTRDGFRYHPGAWVPGGEGGIRYYAHAIDWAARDWAARDWAARDWAARDWAARDWAARDWATLP